MVTGISNDFIQQQLDNGNKETKRREELLKPTRQFADDMDGLPSLHTPFGEILEFEKDSTIETKGKKLLREYEVAYQNAPMDKGISEALAKHLLHMGLLYYQSYSTPMFSS